MTVHRGCWTPTRVCVLSPLLSTVYSISGIANSNCSEGQMRTYEVTRGPHYDADATVAVLKSY